MRPAGLAQRLGRWTTTIAPAGRRIVRTHVGMAPRNPHLYPRASRLGPVLGPTGQQRQRLRAHADSMAHPRPQLASVQRADMQPSSRRPLATRNNSPPRRSREVVGRVASIPRPHMTEAAVKLRRAAWRAEQREHPPLRPGASALTLERVPSLRPLNGLASVDPGRIRRPCRSWLSRGNQLLLLASCAGRADESRRG